MASSLRIVCAIAMLAVPVGAGELGTMVARLDGEPREWRLHAMQTGSRQIATAFFSQSQRMAEVHLQGHAVPDFAAPDVMSLTIRYLGWYMPGDAPFSVDILYVPDGMGGPFWTSEGASRPPNVEIVHFDILGRFGEIELAFTGELCRKPMISAAVDPNNCVEVLGQVTTDLAVQ